MKSILVITILLSFVINSYCQSDTTLPVKIELKLLKSDTLTDSRILWEGLIKREGLEVTTDSVKYKSFDIEVSVKNTSKDSISISFMTCSWWENFIVNNEYMNILPWSCDHNFPEPVDFKSGETKIFPCTLIKSIKFDYPCYGCIYGREVLTTKLGLIVTNVSYTPKLAISTQDGFEPIDKSVWRILWSNPLYLFGEQLKPKQIGVYKN